MNAKEKALVLKEQGQVLRGVSLQTLQEKDASVQQPRKKKNRTQELLHTLKDIACMNQTFMINTYSFASITPNFSH